MPEETTKTSLRLGHTILVSIGCGGGPSPEAPLLPAKSSLCCPRFAALGYSVLHYCTMASSDDDDYMSMVIEDPQQKETFTQKKRREQREVTPSHSCMLHVPAVRITDLAILLFRPRREVESLRKLKELPRKLPNEMKRSQQAPWTPLTRGSR